MIAYIFGTVTGGLIAWLLTWSWFIDVERENKLLKKDNKWLRHKLYLRKGQGNEK